MQTASGVKVLGVHTNNTTFNSYIKQMQSHLSVEQRWDIVYAYKECQNKTAVARKLGYSLKAVSHWVDVYLAQKHSNTPVTLTDMRRCGRPRVVDNHAAKRSVELLTTHAVGSLAQAAQQLHKEGVVSKRVSMSTVSRRAHEQAMVDGMVLEVAQGPPKKELTTKTKEQRYTFACHNKNKPWHATMFTDRKKFQFKYPGSHVSGSHWGIRGRLTNTGAYQPNHPMTLNVYGGITKYGPTQLHVVAGTSCLNSQHKNLKGKQSKNITQAEYQEVLEQTLLPEGSKIFSNQGMSSWQLQQDNDPTHKKPAIHAISEWNATKGKGNVQLLPNWPPNSPDLSPIENLWGIVDAKVNNMGCKTFDEYTSEVKKQFQLLGKQHANRLIGSMKNRLQLCIDRNGGKTGY